MFPWTPLVTSRLLIGPIDGIVIVNLLLFTCVISFPLLITPRTRWVNMSNIPLLYLRLQPLPTSPKQLTLSSTIARRRARPSDGSPSVLQRLDCEQIRARKLKLVCSVIRPTSEPTVVMSKEITTGYTVTAVTLRCVENTLGTENGELIETLTIEPVISMTLIVLAIKANRYAIRGAQCIVY